MFKNFLMVCSVLLFGFYASASQQQNLKDDFRSYINNAQTIGDDYKKTLESPPLPCGDLTVGFLKNLAAELQVLGDRVKDHLAKWERHNLWYHPYWSYEHPECRNISNSLSEINNAFNNIFSAAANFPMVNCIGADKNEKPVDIKDGATAVSEGIDVLLKKSMSLEATLKQCMDEVK
jgi:hypothetical protein